MTRNFSINLNRTKFSEEQDDGTVVREFCIKESGVAWTTNFRLRQIIGVPFANQYSSATTNLTFPFQFSAYNQCHSYLETKWEGLKEKRPRGFMKPCQMPISMGQLNLPIRGIIDNLSDGRHDMQETSGLTRFLQPNTKDLPLHLGKRHMHGVCKLLKTKVLSCSPLSPAIPESKRQPLYRGQVKDTFPSAKREKD